MDGRQLQTPAADGAEERRWWVVVMCYEQPDAVGSNTTWLIVFLAVYGNFPLLFGANLRLNGLLETYFYGVSSVVWETSPDV